MSSAPADAPALQPPAGPLPLEPLDPKLTSIQPGGGVVCRLELAWGRVRRCWLRTFRPGYVRKMAALRKGDFNGCPHEVLDPRDLKFFRNQGGFYWEPRDDPFRWRDRIPFARVGLAELLVFTALTFGPAAALAAVLATYGADLGTPLLAAGWVLTAGLSVCGALAVWFFRDPPRRVPTEPGLVVSPADGTITDVDEVPHDEFIGGPAVRIGIFLSIFSVHINRAPVAGRVVGLRYQAGKFLNALRPESARENEQLALRMQETEYPYRRYVVRQITGAIARRIVCWLKPGDALARGEKFGMIKLGSRTELVLPREAGLTVRTRLGDKVRAGATVLAEYAAVTPNGGGGH
ncbi:phosphatidylserine decarboxylase related protein : Phosphatidylserine decarboxylase OS=Planctomyces maris DSM 8797 GN=PM8797T_11299 PE=4 SV=1: PS_Dcarbxylase [Gemmataceae bacterium]|nr:phosphatidylserine decarboxylase related protein : Phosphatidylserine decarboxylase OS=Planctomyces maris DSM 8797 GN=PM8797T_11299 PE=4 SV=1: PS_Dcarbxylase [Gemmataceae bacterium]VTT99656.1 phosphatidylserine decarboxylase related protein : Phosphatidylserine decarboxylase OS=Planctomyces maris DSM 8797 GN=PM8797T_11299 PE=4 SV=1: PS_Dcarbxylase [Gemmataceae bacterium]